MTDIAGSTRLWESRADTMRQAVKRHDAIIHQAVTDNGGKLIKERGEGDSHFCVFEQPANAIRAAIEIQQRLPKEEWETGAPMSVRMSIHSAHAEPVAGDYYGRDVNRCARIRAAGHGGQILVSDSTRESVADFEFLDLGLHRLLDLSEPQRIYQVLAPDIQSAFAPLKSLNAVKHNLPVQLTSFIGREKELEELRKLTMGPRLVTILGPGGAGKTRTALQLAAESIERVKDGVWFVDLSPLKDATQLTQKVIEDLHIKIGVDEPEVAVAAHFENQAALLVLDNCEHVSHEAAVFAQNVLKKCPGLYLLATSREPLGVAGEFAYRLPAMNVITEKAVQFDDIAHLDSVRLLMERARTRGFEEVLRNAKPQTVLDLCKKLDGIPLALEQAAANLGVMSPDVMLARLDEQLAVLRIDDEGVEARHRTISAAIDWSFDTLTDEERNLFLDLAIFVGGWTLEAAESICTARNVLSTMQRLVAKSLVWPEATAHGDRRFRLLETMREYAIEKGGPQSKDILDRHLAYYAHLAKLAAEAGLDVDEGKWSRALDSNYPNIVAALSRAVVSTEHGEDGLAFAVSLVRYWIRRDYLRDAATWFQKALEAAPNASNDLRADALTTLGVVAWRQKKANAAETAFENSLSIWKRLGNMSKVGATLNNLALVAMLRNDIPGAKKLLYEAADVFEAQNDDNRLVQAISNVAMMESDEGNAIAAIELEERALKIHRRLLDRESLGVCITNLLGLYAEKGELALHLDLVEESLTIAMEIDSPAITMVSLDVVAHLATDSNQEELAARMIGAASRFAESSEGSEATRSNRFRDCLRERLQTLLGRKEFRSSFEKGAKLTGSQAISLAREFVESLD